MGRIELEKLDNTRDLGGLVTADGKRIKRKKLIRSGTLIKASDKDKKTLTEDYELKTVVDFRTEVERTEKPDPELDGVKFIFDPILEVGTFGVTREKVTLKDMPKAFEGITENPMSYMKRMYSEIILDEHAQKGYATFFDTLLTQESGSVLWHCSAGKDRVGVGTALLLTVLGVDRGTIVNDYLLTGKYCKKTIRLLHLLIALFVRNDSGVYLKYLMDVKPEYILSAFETIEKNYGSVENYLTQTMDFSREKQEALRKKYLE